MKNNIKQLRKDLGLSQQQLADAVDISVEKLDSIESNYCMPSLLTAYSITIALKKDYIADVFIFDD